MVTIHCQVKISNLSILKIHYDVSMMHLIILDSDIA